MTCGSKFIVALSYGLPRQDQCITCSTRVPQLLVCGLHLCGRNVVAAVTMGIMKSRSRCKPCLCIEAKQGVLSYGCEAVIKLQNPRQGIRAPHHSVQCQWHTSYGPGTRREC